MTDPRRSIGARAEDLACRVLEARGYKILERNVRAPFGEIDVVARDGATIVFVEVRARSSTRFGLPCESVGPAKRARLVRLAQWYLLTRRLEGRAVRFDILSVTAGRVDILRDAFEAPGD